MTDSDMMMDGMGMMVWGVFSFLLGLLLIFLFLVGAVVAVRWLWGQKSLFGAAGQENALEVLKKRYARGEISKDEFEKIKRDIE
jgi:putative membrane protein